MEEWKALVGYEGYEYFNKSVRSVDRIVKGRFGDTKRKGKVLLLQGIGDQRQFFKLSKNGIPVKVYLSSLDK